MAVGIAGKGAGPRGLALLAATAVAGTALAVHGWAGRHAGLAPGSLAGMSASPSARAKPPPPARPGGSSGPAARASPTRAASRPSPGPLLRSQSFAPYSYRIWPGALRAAARAALTGLSVSVHRNGAGVSVTAGVTGQPAAAPRFYPLGAKVYVVEATLGDDSGSSDYNLGDDGLVVTTAQGRIVQ